MIPIAQLVGETPPEKPADKPVPDKPEDQAKKETREREYPLLGCDSYGALSDDAAPYGTLPTDDPMDEGFRVTYRAGGASSK